MFKFKKDKGSFGSQPSTPKIPKASLPEVGGGEDVSPKRPKTPWLASPRPVIARPASTRPFIVRAETPQPSTPPLKPCLKPRTRTTTITGDDSPAVRAASKLRDDYCSPVKPSPTTRQRTFSMTGGGTPMAKPKKVTPPPNCTYVPMKPPHLPPVKLHWQLLPHNSNPRCIGKAQLHFDITLPVTHLCKRTATEAYSLPLSRSELSKPVADEPLQEMTIECEYLPKWYIRIRRPTGISCCDVFEEIFRTYHHVLSDDECSELEGYPRDHRSRVKAAFKARCAESPSLFDYEESQGYRRVDLLKGRTIFLGLTQPKPSSNWFLKLGYPQH